MKLDYRLYICIILNFHGATHVLLVQNESCQQNPEKTKNNGEQERQLLTL